MTVSTSGARHLLLRLADPARLPEAMLGVLRDEVVLAGWMRGSGVLSDVQIRVGTAPPRHIAGPVQAVVLEGSVGLAAGDVSCGFRVVLAHETEAGELETIAGDLVEARVNALEVHVTAFDEVVATRQLDPSGVWLLDATSTSVPAAQPAPAPAPRPVAAAPAPAPAPAPQPSSFAAVVRADEAPAPPPAPPVARPSPTFSNTNAMPSRIAKPILPEEEEQAIPEPGDIVEHFAFGRCEVVKTDGDRLHVRLPKDQRVKEIALEMLRVSLIPAVDGESTKHYKLARKL
ncbi:MAG TPA: hypothetical protein VLT33_40520 [Labilithrix sp.]|nr:hypothetical protein [Labilithrix sp.]